MSDFGAANDAVMSSYGAVDISGMSSYGATNDAVMSSYGAVDISGMSDFGAANDAVMSSYGATNDAVMSGSGAVVDISGMSGSGPKFHYTVVKGDGDVDSISILTITAPVLDLNTMRKVFFRIDADTSGSMEGPKMDNVKECLCRFVRMLLGYKKTYPLFTFYVSIVAFDTRLFTISPVVTINEDTVHHLITQINMMREGGGTAFDKPFIDAQKQISEFKVDHPDATILRLFLSDGEVNKGIADKDELYKMLHEPEVPVAVVGLCDGHDVETMIALGNSPTSTYIYIAEPESFGPLISDFLSKMFVVTTDVTIHCDGSGNSDGDQSLYDFRTGWNSSLTIPVLTSEQIRSFYIQGNSGPLTVSFTHNGITETVIVNHVPIERDIHFEIALLRLECIKLMTRTLHHIDEQYKVHREPNDCHMMDGPDDCYEPDDCCGMIRHRGCYGMNGPDECVASFCAPSVPEPTMVHEQQEPQDAPKTPEPQEAQEAPTVPSLEQVLRDALQKLVEFTTENILQEDELINQLCKDLEICLKALFAPHNIAKAFVSARLLAQAEQKCVTISDTSVLDNLTQRHVSGLYDANFTPFSRTCTADSTPSCGDIMRSMS